MDHAALQQKVKVGLLSCVLAVAAAAFYLPVSATWERPSTTIPFWVLLLLFVVCDLLVIHVELRGDVQTFTLSVLPLVLAWFFSVPSELVMARMVAGVIVIFVSRQVPLKAVFNSALMLFDACFTLWVFHTLSMSRPELGIRAWPAALIALAVASAIETLAIALAIRMAGGTAHGHQVRTMVAFAVLGHLTLGSLALLAVAAVIDTPWAGTLAAVVVGVVYVVLRGHADMRQRYEKLHQLYEFTQMLSRSPELGSAARAILSETRDLLRSGRAELALRTADGSRVMRVTLDEHGELLTGGQPEDASDPAFLATTRTREPTLIGRGPRNPEEVASLEGRGAKDLLMVPLVKGDEVYGTLTALDRLGDIATFDEEDVKVLTTFAHHASMALENARLIDELRRQVEDRQHEALHDSLTGLANRSHFLQSTVEALTRARPDGRVGVMLMDLDRFKEINDTLGHHHGDLLLQEVAKRLVSIAPAEALVARLGGDEFAILLPSVASPLEAVARSMRVHEIFDEGFFVEGIELSADGSIGVAVSPEHGTTPEELLQRADVAMYVAKDSEQASVTLYEEAQNQNSARRLALAGALRHSIDNRDLTIAYQPQARLLTSEIVGVEALARWEHPTFGRVGPDEFIPLAEHVGLMRPLTLLVLDKALGQLRQWRDEGLSLAVAVNLSVRNLLDANLPHDVKELLERHGVEPSFLTLEITESQIMRDPERAMVILSRLRGLGVELSIDDFGTGHSSLAYLKQLPVDEVKIDRAFIAQVVENGIDCTIVRSIVDVARDRGLRVVAEGIEDQATWEVLRGLGCDLAQGYHLSRPLPAPELTPWLEQQMIPRAPAPLATR